MKLYDEHLYYEDGVKHIRFDQLAIEKYRPEYVETRVVGSESSDHAYLLGKVRGLDTPYHEGLDVVKHRCTAWLCSCDDFWFNRSKGVETGELGLDDLGECKHVRSEVRELRAREDEQQSELVE